MKQPFIPGKGHTMRFLILSVSVMLRLARGTREVLLPPSKASYYKTQPLKLQIKTSDFKTSYLAFRTL